jgi:CheY-like chemotaxis protein
VQVHPEADAQSLLASHPNACLLIFDLVGDETQAMDMLKSIRQSFAWSGIPAVILVPDGARALREMLEMRLANRVVSKPVDAHRIAEVVLSLSWGNP